MAEDKPTGVFDELGTPGLQMFAGVIQQAYTADLRWPKVIPLYSRLRRADPEVAIVRQVYSSMARGCRMEFALPEKPSDDDKKFADFGAEVLDDIEGGQGAFLSTMVDHAPFWGWGWWETVPGIRNPDWNPPGDDPWRSSYKDGLIGFRRFAWRDPTSFFQWDADDATKRVNGLKQMDIPNPIVTIPIDRSIHLTFGDSNNPEGLSPLEALARLERVKYALELIQGIGFEHTAGVLNVSVKSGTLEEEDKRLIRTAARAALTAQEGNYLALPEKFTAELMEVAFSAAAALLEAIKYYGILKLQLYNMQWAALSATTGAGSYSAMSDSSGMFVITWNAMMGGFADQIDAQFGKRLLKLNADKFPKITKRPRLTITPIEKQISLTEIGQLISAIGADNLTPEDWLAIRKASHVLPQKNSERQEESGKKPKEQPGLPGGEDGGNGNMDDMDGQQKNQKKGKGGKNGKNGKMDAEEMMQQGMGRFTRWAAENDPETYALLTAEVP